MQEQNEILKNEEHKNVFNISFFVFVKNGRFLK